MKIDWARLNHVLVPATKSGRDRLRKRRLPRRLRLFVWLYTRLSREGRALFVVVCSTSMLAVDVGRTESHVLAAASGALLFATLLFTRFYAMPGVTIEARAPRRVAIGDEMKITISVANQGERVERAIRIEAPLLPWDGAWVQSRATLEELAPGAHESAVVSATFRVRGEHQLDPFRAAALLPLGLSQGAPVSSEGVRFIVVPKLARVLSVTIPQNQQHSGGRAQASRAGDRTALLGVRPYRVGDPVRDLHARSWARHGEPVVREYHEEHLSRIAVILDTEVRPDKPRQLEAALSLAAGAIAALCKSDDVVDLLIAGEFVERLALSRNRASVDRALDVLAAVQPGQPFATDRMLTRLMPHLSRLSAALFIALDWDERRQSALTALRRHGLNCSALLVSDRATPNASIKVIDPELILAGEALVL